jgi:hypothetical protein
MTIKSERSKKTGESGRSDVLVNFIVLNYGQVWRIAWEKGFIPIFLEVGPNFLALRN